MSIQQTELGYEETIRIIKCLKDPIYFINKYVKHEHSTSGQSSLELYNHQKRLITSYKDHPYNIVRGARQTFITSTGWMFLLWYATFHFDKNIVIVSHTAQQARHILASIKQAHNLLPPWLRSSIETEKTNELSFGNGCKILCYSTPDVINSTRGTTISLLFYDLFDLASPEFQKQFLYDIMPCFTQNMDSKCIITSTGTAYHSPFLELYKDATVGKNGFIPHTISWQEVHDSNFAFETTKMIGREAWKREYECDFGVDNGG